MGDIGRNYTGDVLNFSAAYQTYVAEHPEKANKIKMVIVGDDVSVGRTKGALVGRRAMAGTMLGTFTGLSIVSYADRKRSLQDPRSCIRGKVEV